MVVSVDKFPFLFNLTHIMQEDSSSSSVYAPEEGGPPYINTYFKETSNYPKKGKTVVKAQ